MTLDLYFDRFPNVEGIYHICGYDSNNNLVMEIACDGYEIKENAVLIESIGLFTSIIGYIRRSIITSMYLDDEGEFEQITGEYKTE